MMTYVFSALIIIGGVFGLLTGRIDNVSNAVIESEANAVTLSFTLLGTMSLWTGLMKVADKAGLTEKISNIFSPVFKLLFPSLKKGSAAVKAISMNISANMLGLGNAATPLGITAMKELNLLNEDKNTASRDMIMFVVLNTASIQIIPTTIATLRLKNGAQNPLDILPAVLITSAVSISAGIISVFAFGCKKYTKLPQNHTKSKILQKRS